MPKIFCNPSTPQHAEFIERLPEIFDTEGEVIYQGRNVLKRFVNEGQHIIVKSYCDAVWFNRIVYRFFRAPKAQRSYEYAELLLGLGVGSPLPVGYNIQYRGLMIGRSFFACLESECPYTYRDFRKHSFANEKDILLAIADTTAKLHENGVIHKDYSAGNILFGTFDDKVKVEIIDLNRIRFEKVGMEEGCRNFDRLPGSPEALRIMSDEYARLRGFDPDACYRIFIDTHGAENKYIR